MDLDLVPDTWYRAELVADFNAKRYVSLEVEGNGQQASVDISDVTIEIAAKEVQVGLGTWITLDGESLWTECAEAVTSNTLYVTVSWVGEPGDPVVPDADLSATFAEDVSWLLKTGITQGCDAAGNFWPKEEITRAQMASFIAWAFQVVDQSTGEFEFKDAGGSTHIENIMAIAALGITRGCSSDGELFCPDDDVSREQMTAFIRRAMEAAISKG